MAGKENVSRDAIIARTSILGVVANLLIALVKVFAGIASSSIAIITEGVNNASDALTSVLTFVGSKLAKKHPDAKHPFGHGRIEYLSGLAVSVLIIVTGVEMLKSSVELIFHPAKVNIGIVSLAIVAFSAVLKFILGVHTIRMGKKAKSETLVALGLDCRNDSFASIVTIASAVIFIATGKSIDAFAGVFMSLVIGKAGIEVLRETVSDLLGKSGDADLAALLYAEIRKTPCVLNAADMMLHNYGPDAYSGSVNVEIDHEKTVGEIYRQLHALQLRIMHERHVTMVFGVYAVDNDHDESKKVRETVAEFVKSRDHVKSFHAIFIENESKKIYCDLVVDYDLHDWDALKADFLQYMAEKYPDEEVELTIETEFV